MSAVNAAAVQRPSSKSVSRKSIEVKPRPVRVSRLMINGIDTLELEFSNGSIYQLPRLEVSVEEACSILEEQTGVSLKPFNKTISVETKSAREAHAGKRIYPIDSIESLKLNQMIKFTSTGVKRIILV